MGNKDVGGNRQHRLSKERTDENPYGDRPSCFLNSISQFGAFFRSYGWWPGSQKDGSR